MMNGTPIIRAIIQYNNSCTRRACRFSSSVGSMARTKPRRRGFSNRSATASPGRFRWRPPRHPANSFAP